MDIYGEIDNDSLADINRNYPFLDPNLVSLAHRNMVGKYGKIEYIEYKGAAGYNAGLEIKKKLDENSMDLVVSL